MKYKLTLGIFNIILSITLGSALIVFPPNDFILFVVVFLLMTVMLIVGTTLIVEKDNA